MSYKITKVEVIRHPDMPGPIVRGIIEYDDGRYKFFNARVDEVPSTEELEQIVAKHLAEQ